MALILNREEVASVLTMKDTIDAVEQAFRDLAEGKAEMPVRPTIRVPDPPGVINVMPAYLGTMGALGMKLVSGYPQNPSKFDMPTIQATILYSDCRTGKLLAIMEGGYITAVRTGAASGVATKYMARKESATVGVLGSGIQAGTQLEAICAVRKIKSVKVYSPTAAHREDFAKRMASKLGVDVAAVDAAEKAVRGLDIVIAASSSKQPILRGEWLSPGAHINGIGSHTTDARELDESAVKKSRVVVDAMDAALREAGDLLMPMADGAIGKEHIVAELGEVVLGRKAGRARADEITLFKSQGLAIEDVCTAKLVYERAKAQGKGTELNI
ncbi:MAG TPA: ornithine cyclodeaminase family protein [Candidatus Binatia bacterium]